ncbi:MAG: PQQ-dependent sugar dehydrogenase, partial [Pseudomonadota bacterium]
MRIVRLTALVTLVAGGGILAASYTPPPAAETVFETSAGPVTVTRLVSGLNTPWAVAPLPGGGALITEKGGRLLHFDDAWESRTISG